MHMLGESRFGVDFTFLRKRAFIWFGNPSTSLLGKVAIPNTRLKNTGTSS